VGTPDPDEHTRQLAAESLAGDDVTGWFERLYREADRGEAVVPWDRGGPHPLLVQWAQGSTVLAGRAIVVGAGPGSDAELIAGLGPATVAFDVSPTAIRAARERFPGSAVDYVVADLLDPPTEWRGAFDLVVESLTVQSMPRSVRAAATANVAGFVAPGGTLVVIAFAAVGTESGGTGAAGDGPPWPMTKDDIDAFAAGGVQPVGIELVPNPADPGTSRWLAEFRRAAATEPQRHPDVEQAYADPDAV
jgi:ubiquinone/menaquinone biosynthesis C-methylase UbiE